MKESLEEVMSHVDISIKAAQAHNLEIEILSSALIYLKANPHETIHQALVFGYYEWVK